MLPQLDLLADLAEVLGPTLRVGGSFARGEADELSDLDLTFDAPEGWTIDSLDHLLIAVQPVPLGERLLWHGVAYDGTVVDLIPGPPPLGAKPAMELVRPDSSERPPVPIKTGVPIETGVHAEYWIHTYKHAKPLRRGIETLCAFGLAHDRTFLIRLWSLADSGFDPGPSLGGIHAMARLLPPLVSSSRLELLGRPARNRVEIVETILAIRAEVVALGLSGADRLRAFVSASGLTATAEGRSPVPMGSRSARDRSPA